MNTKDKEQLIINISGVTGSGKSTLAYIIRNFLIRGGYNIEFEQDIDFKNMADFDKCMKNTMEERKSVIKKSRLIKINQTQIQRKIKS